MPSDTLRESFEKKADELSIALDKLRPGTGPGVAILVMQAWDEGYAAGASAMKEKAAAALNPDLGQDLLNRLKCWVEGRESQK
jgi:hypothetical protein